MIENKNIPPKRKWVILSVFLIIYLTDTLLFATSTISALTLARRFVPVIIAAIMLFTQKAIDFSLVFVFFSLFISMLLYYGNLYFYVSAIALLFCGYAYSKYVSLEEFEDAFIKWMRIIAIVSLIGFFFGSVIKTIGFLPTVTNTVYRSYKVLFLTNIPISDSLSRRNLGPFWEPGAYQYYLNIALIFVLHKQGKMMWFDTALFLITLLTTMSGAAILPLPFIMLAYIVNNRKANSIKPFIFICAIAILGVILLQTGRFDEILNKITGEQDDGFSRGFRIGSAWANLQMAIKYPLFGANPALQDELRLETIQSLNGYATSGNTNTFLGYASYFGVFVGVYLCNKLYGFCRRMSQSGFGTFCLFIALFLMTSNENLILSALLYVLMFLQLKSDMVTTNNYNVKVRTI